MDSKIIPLAKVDFPIWRPVEQLMGIIYTNQEGESCDRQAGGAKI